MGWRRELGGWVSGWWGIWGWVLAGMTVIELVRRWGFGHCGGGWAARSRGV